jgi:hypothetical protein
LGALADLTHRRSPIPSGELEIKLEVYFRHTSVSLEEQLRAFTTRYNYDWETQPVIGSQNANSDEDEN